MHNPTLHFFSYDSMGNPWLGGGGSVRDLEMLQHYAPAFPERHLYVGAYPGCQDGVRDGVYWHFLGKGFRPGNEWTSRLAFVLSANRLLRKPLPGWVGVNLSPYAPLVRAAGQKRVFGILHHFIGPKWKQKVPLLGGVIEKLEYAYYRKFPKIVTINGVSTELIRRLNPRAGVFQSANACDSALFCIEDQSRDADPFVLFFGRLDRFMKGLDLLIEAFAAVASRFPGYKLVLAGRCDSKQRESMQALLAPHPHLPVQLVENPTEAQRGELLGRCQFFCSPSRFEGWGIAALEACAAGKPALVSRASGFLDSVSPEAGWHVDVEHPGALADQLEALMGDHAQVEAKKLAAREWAQRFTWDAIFRAEQQWLFQESEAHDSP